MTSPFLLLRIVLVGLFHSTWCLSPSHMCHNPRTITFQSRCSNYPRTSTSSSLAMIEDEDSSLWAADDSSQALSSEGDDEDDELPTDEELLATKGDWDPRVAEMNTAHLIGRIGNDPEPRYFDDGNVVVNLSLACTRKIHYMEREAYDIKWGQEPTDWYGLEIWGKQAEFISKFIDKGARVAVTGSLQIDEWTDKQTGEKRESVKVIVREFDVLETKAESELRRGGGGSNRNYYNNNNNQGRGGGGNNRGSSFYVNDPDDEYNPRSGNDGGFFS